jgi:diacylglycerol kinase family enzyme
MEGWFTGVVTSVVRFPTSFSVMHIYLQQDICPRRFDSLMIAPLLWNSGYLLMPGPKSEMDYLAPDRGGVPILANPRAGSGKSRRIVEELVAALRSRGFAPFVCWQREQLGPLLASDELRCVVAAGGDGTLLEVINRAPGVPVTVLPLGNENLVARHCGICRSGRMVADIVAAGRVNRLDLARANGRLFCLMASVGLDADVVHRVHRKRRGHINRLSYAVPLLQALGEYRFPSIEVEVEETGERIRGATVFVFNLPEYALGLPIAAGGNPQDGLLDLCVFERPGVLELLRYLAAVVVGKHQEMPDFQHRRVRVVHLSTTEPAPLQTDGDPAGCLPGTIEVLPQALPMLVPEKQRKE